jgi:hypothetical protein
MSHLNGARHRVIVKYVPNTMPTHERGYMTSQRTPTKQYVIGKPFDIEELKKPQRARVVSLRDQELEKAITQAAAGAASQVIPFSFDPERDKAGTVKAAAKRIVKAMQVPVNVGYNAAKYPNAILLSRGVLSNRGRRSR